MHLSIRLDGDHSGPGSKTPEIRAHAGPKLHDHLGKGLEELFLAGFVLRVHVPIEHAQQPGVETAAQRMGKSVLRRGAHDLAGARGALAISATAARRAAEAHLPRRRPGKGFRPEARKRARISRASCTADLGMPAASTRRRAKEISWGITQAREGRASVHALAARISRQQRLRKLGEPRRRRRPARQGSSSDGRAMSWLVCRFSSSSKPKLETFAADGGLTSFNR